MLYAPPSDGQLAQLEAALGYQFADRRLLHEALLHPSYFQGGQPNNYRLAWLGDAVLTMVASSELFEERGGLPTHTPKGELHSRRERAKTNAACASFALELSLDELLVVGRAYFSQAPSDRMLAEAFEAVLGAVWEDSHHSFDAVSAIYQRVAGH